MPGAPARKPVAMNGKAWSATRPRKLALSSSPLPELIVYRASVSWEIIETRARTCPLFEATRESTESPPSPSDQTSAEPGGFIFRTFTLYPEVGRGTPSCLTGNGGRSGTGVNTAATYAPPWQSTASVVGGRHWPWHNNVE